MMILRFKNIYDIYRFIRPVLVPLVPLYLLAFKLTALFKRPEKCGIPVVCIGNITTGGTGKTPAVIEVAGLLKDAGFFPAVISRGYGGASSKSGALLSDGRRIFLTPRESGDEPYLLAKRISGTPVSIGADRIRAVRRLDDTGPDIIIMDDGLQNFSIHKDVSIVVIDAMRPFGNGLILPAGDLRQPAGNFSNGDIIIINRSDMVSAEKLDRLTDRLKRKKPGIPIFTSFYKDDCIYRANDPEHAISGSLLKGKRLLLISAVGNPDSFFKIIKRYEPAGIKFYPYPDHYIFNKGDIKRFNRDSGFYDYVVITEKDYIKMGEFSLNERFYVLRISMNIKNREQFRESLLSLLPAP